MKYIGRLHVLTDTQLQKRFSHVELAKMALAGGADAIQYRQKYGATREMIETASQIKELCDSAGALFIVNDRIDIAMASDADGVHLGQDDFPIALARKILGKDKIIGGSAGDIKEAIKCVSEGADYIGLGPVFQTLSKEDAGPATGIETIKAVLNEVSLPVIVIGGINLANLDVVKGTGVYGIAVISAVCCTDDPLEATKRLKEALKHD